MDYKQAALLQQKNERLEQYNDTLLQQKEAAGRSWPEYDGLELNPCCKGWHNNAHEFDCPQRLLNRIESLEMMLEDRIKRIRILKNMVMR